MYTIKPDKKDTLFYESEKNILTNGHWLTTIWHQVKTNDPTILVKLQNKESFKFFNKKIEEGFKFNPDMFTSIFERAERCQTKMTGIRGLVYKDCYIFYGYKDGKKYFLGLKQEYVDQLFLECDFDNLFGNGEAEPICLRVDNKVISMIMPFRIELEELFKALNSKEQANHA